MGNEVAKKYSKILDNIMNFSDVQKKELYSMGLSSWIYHFQESRINIFSDTRETLDDAIRCLRSANPVPASDY